MASLPYRQNSSGPRRKVSTDPHNELRPHLDHYIGIDVGTGSARACIMNSQGDIVGLASENIGLWQVRFPSPQLLKQYTDNVQATNWLL